MAELEGLYVALNADVSGLDRGMRSAEQSVARTERSVTGSLGRMDRAMEQVNRSTAAIAQRFGQFAAVLGVGGIAAMAAKTLDYAEAWTQVGNRLRLVSQDAGELKATQEQLFQAAQKAGVSMGAVVDVYARASQAAGELGASQEQLTRFSGGVAQALAVSGTSAEAASGAMQQLGQLLGSTRVQAEEFNSILDGAPRVAKAVADGLTEAGGSVSRLKQLINDGKVSNKQFFDAFLGQIPKIQAEFETAVPTIGRSLATLNNAMTKLIGEANEATGATATLARGITALADNLSAVATGAAAVGAALAGAYVARGLVPAISATAALVKAWTGNFNVSGHILEREAALRRAARASIDIAAADVMAAQAAQQKARADLVARAAQYEHAVAIDGAIGKTARLVQAEEALTAARTARAAADLRLVETTAALTMAQGAQTSAIARTTLAATVLSRAKDGLLALSSLVGGPWGAAFLGAAGVVYLLATRTSEADKAQQAYSRTLSEGRDRLREITGASGERAAQLLEEQRAAVEAARAQVALTQARLAAVQADAATGNLGARRNAGAAASRTEDAKRALADQQRAVQAAAAALDGLESASQKTGDAVGLELASKLSRGTSAFQRLSASTGDALKQAGLTIQSGRLMTTEQAETEKAVTALGQALQAGAGFLRTYGTNADQVGRIMDALKLKIDPVASAVADMNREIAQLGVAEGAARSALTVLQQINQQREKEGKTPLTTVSPEYLTLLGKAQEVETKRVEAATAARTKVLDLEKQIAQAQAAGNAVGAAELQRQKAVEQMVARGVDREVAKKNAAQDYAVAITEAGAAAGQAAKDILLAADAQMVMAQAAGLGEAATRQATYATKLAQEAAKGNGNVLAVQAANRREEAATIVQIRNETVRGLELETANTNALTMAMAAGGAAVRVAQEQEYKLALIRKLGTDATVAGTEAQKALNDAMEAYRNNRAANDNNRLEQERQSANDNLALAQRELDLMGQSDALRDRSLTTLRNQQEAARKVAELGEDGARQWLAWQEQIADKRAYVDFLKSVQQTAKEISGDISEALYDRLMDPGKATSVVDVFKSIFKRIAVAALEANVVLPIVTQVVGSMPSLFGITAPAGATGAAGSTSTGGLVNFGVSKGLGYLWDKAGGSSALDTLSGWLGLGGGSAGLAAGTLPSASVQASQIAALQAVNPGFAASSYVPVGGGVNAAMGTGTAGGMSLGTLGSIAGGALSLAGAGYSIGGYFGTKANSKAVGGLTGGAAAGALAGTMAMPGIGTVIGAVIGAIAGMIGTQKASVGPTVSSGINRSADGKSVTSGGYLTDNGGDVEAAKSLGDTIALTVNTALLGGGSLTRDLGIGRTQSKGLYVSGSLPYKDFGDDVAGMYRYTLLDSGTLKDGGANTVKAIRNSKAKDFEEAAKDIGLGASIDAGTTALAALDKSLASFTKAAKESTAEALKPMLDELARAKSLDLGSAYVKLATDQLNAYLDQLRNPPDYTQTEQDMASLTGQFQAIREAYQQLNPALVATVDQIEKETRARIQASVQDDANRQLNSALGRGYINSINDLVKARDINARNLTASGLGTQRATEIFDASLKSLLDGLGASDLDVVAASFTGSIHDLAVSMKSATEATAAATAAQEAAAAAQEAATKAAAAAAERAAYTADLNSRLYAAVGNDRGAGLIALDQQQAQALAQAKAAGYDTTLLIQVQAAERASQAFQLAQADVLAAYDAQISAQQSLVESLQAGAEAVRQFRQAYDALAVNDNSPLNARDRLAEARRQFEAAYTTAKDASASEAERTAALATLQQLGPQLVQLARAYYATTDSADYDRVRQVFAEFGGLQAQGVDAAQQQLDTANDMLKELQRQRAEAASLGQKQYGALTGLKDILDQSYAVWLAALGPLKALTGTNDNSPRYAAPANVQAAWNGLSGDQQMGIARAMGWGGGLDEAFNIWLATSGARASAFGGNVLSIAGGTRYGAPATVQSAWGALTQAQQLAAIRSAGYDGGIDGGLNAWVALGHQAAFEAAVKAQAHLAGIPGYAIGTPSALPGLAWVGERGPELVRMAGGERVYPHEASMAMARRFQVANDRLPEGVVGLRAPEFAADLVSEIRKFREEARQDARAIISTIIAMSEKQEDVLREENAELRRRIDKQSQELRLGQAAPKYATKGN